MAHIPQEEIERIKHEVRIEELVGARAIALKTHGQNLLGLCPFHNDHEPSLVVTPEKNLWHCMGACQTGGDVFAWVQKTEGVSFRHAYELLSTRFFVASPSDGLVLKKRSDVPKLGSPFTLEMDDDELRLAYIDYCHEELKRSPEVSRYLEKRGLISSELVTEFRLGFSNRTLGLRLPAMSRKEGQAIRSRLQNLGILRSSGHEHFNGCLMIPIFDKEGNVTEIYGRKITQRLTPGLAHHLYLPGPHRGVWNWESLRVSKEIILCEALIDAMSFWCAGYRNVTASYGTEGFTADHLAAIKHHGTERVFIAYDADEAGNAAAGKLASKLMAEGIDCFRVELPKGMDVNEYAAKMSPPAKALGILVRAASWLGNGEKKLAGVAAPAAARSEQGSPLLAAAPGLTPTQQQEPVAPPPEGPAHGGLPLDPASEEIVFPFGDRSYRIRGMKKATTFDSLRINVFLTRESVGSAHLDSFDLAVARQRIQFEKHAASEIGVAEEVVHRDMGHILRSLEEVRRQQIAEVSRPKVKAITMTEADRAKALEHLRAPDLVRRTIDHITRCGLVGEETNKLMAYLAAVSRKLDEPLAIIIQSSSAAGKTMLMDAILKMMPLEDQEHYSAVTGKALFYIGEDTSLKHKILAISEEEGAEQATYALKLLQSEGKLSIASTGKDPQTGKLVTQEYHVEGPVMIFLTTTAIDIDEELLNRCIVLTVNEEREQTRAIHKVQRYAQTIEGLLGKREAAELHRLHQNVQRLLLPVLVANPFATELTFLDGRTRARRDHMKYLTLIRAIALLHQYQRPRKQAPLPDGTTVEYIEVERSDIALANELAHEVLGRSLDELPPQTRRLLELAGDYVTGECKRRQIERSELLFSRRTLREVVGWSETQIRVHLDRLMLFEYVLVHRGGRGQSFVYELLYEKREEKKSLLFGLADARTLGTMTATSRGKREPSRGREADLPGGLAGSKRWGRGQLAE